MASDITNREEPSNEDDQPITGEVWLRGLGKLPSLLLLSPEGQHQSCRCIYSTIQGVYPTLMSEILAIASIESIIRNQEVADHSMWSKQIEIKEIYVAHTFCVVVCQVSADNDHLEYLVIVLKRTVQSYNIHSVFESDTYDGADTLITLMS